jgi:8-oxo-dGTP pyrophosphatase MutT (NUDIX family)
VFGHQLHVIRRRSGGVGENHRMRRELSAGGIVLHRRRGRLWLAAIRPRGKPPGTWALPKGHVEAGEPPGAAAVRETAEETGLRTSVVRRVGESRYVFTWDGDRVAKVVIFFLLRRHGGRIGDLPPGMEREVAEVRWLPVDEARALLAYRREAELVEVAARLVRDEAL